MCTEDYRNLVQAMRFIHDDTPIPVWLGLVDHLAQFMHLDYEQFLADCMEDTPTKG